ncbi:unknown [Feldmannia species virus]|uniref:Uncharacterized protein n=1 Tax=Feldmannia species virus TaxID=39420 RepID=B5LWL4_9PHYC|nr:hypothetical protein FeldSpV_gp125 [Feldmannia species virus]ACH46877.1 unknown [Feldmannia species virus]
MDQFRELYRDITSKNAIVDISAMDTESVDSMKSFLYRHAKTGDRLNVNVRVRDRTLAAQVSFVENQSCLGKLDSSLFLPFEAEKPSSVRVGKSTIAYENQSVLVDGRVVPFGTEFVLDGRRVVLAEGSVVLLVEDLDTREFPHTGVIDEVLSNDTSAVAFGTIVVSSTNQISSEDGEVVAYAFVRSAEDDQRVCVTKRTACLLADGMGEVSCNVRGEDGDLKIVAVYSTADLCLSSTNVGVEGLSFDSDNAAIMFGSSGEFRIRYSTDDDAVQIQFKDPVSGSYITKREFGR